MDCLLVCCALLLFGCVSTTTTTAGIVYDRYRLQHTLSDQWIAMQASYLLSNQPQSKSSNISVSCVNRTILLVGQTQDPQFKQRLPILFGHINGVKKILNFVEIRLPIDALQTTKDTWITTKIKSKLLATPAIDPKNIKVITENNIVFLLGTVTTRQASLAIKLAQTTHDVQKIVTVFQHMVIEGE